MTLLKTVQAALGKNILLSSEIKAHWAERLDEMDDVELRGLLAILEQSNDDVNHTFMAIFEKDSDGKFLREFKKFKKEKIHAMSDQVQAKEARDAESVMARQLEI